MTAARLVVDGGIDLATTRVDRAHHLPRAEAVARLGGDCLKRRHADCRHFQRHGKAARGRNADAHAGERTRPDADRDRAEIRETRHRPRASRPRPRSSDVPHGPCRGRERRGRVRVPASVSKTQAAQRVDAVSMTSRFMARQPATGAASRRECQGARPVRPQSWDRQAHGFSHRAAAPSAQGGAHAAPARYSRSAARAP